MKSNTQATIVWFRRDLRINNNPALNSALRCGHKVIPIIVYDTDETEQWSMGAASKWWYYESLKSLQASLSQLDLKLHFFTGDPRVVIPDIAKAVNASSIYWNNRYEPDELKLELDLAEQLGNLHINKFDSGLLFRPNTILNNAGKPYRVFTPFWKVARARLETSGVNLAVLSGKDMVVTKYRGKIPGELQLDELGLLDKADWHVKLHKHWLPGEKSAHRRLDYFIQNTLQCYDETRDIPASDGTSRLSPHLHFGEITPAQIIYRLQQSGLSSTSNKSVERFIAEIGWREFASHILWHFPHTTNNSMYDKYAQLWSSSCNKQYLSDWQEGNTGIPMIDAGMRQLWETGWMHNRVRMIVGSFLTKNLGISWLHGARWFWDTLVDADLASNTLGWQWVAGCGVDAAPYYRIFNPETQTRRFDPRCEYINRWIPEEHNLPGRQPLVDLKQSREEALSRYRQLQR